MEQLPILPLGQLVVYPHVVLPLALTDPNAVQLIDEVVRGNKRLLLGVVKPIGGTEPVEGAVMQARAEELYEVGTLGSVVRMLKLGDGSVRVMVQGLERARLVEISPGPHWLVASYTTFSSELTEDARTEALKRTVHAQFSRVIDIAPYLGEELHEVLAGITDAGKLADFVAANIDLALPAKAELLAIDEVNKRLERLAELLGQELQVLEVGSQIQEKVKSRLDQNQREYVLREQLRVIRQELGEDEGEDELDELGRRLEQAGVSPEAKKVVDRELKRLRQMSPQSAEYHVARTYLEAFASLPWSRTSEDRRDLKAAREILDRDHYDLKTVKERILEYLAVRTLNPQAKGSILCFVGPPGVGKTSLGQSIAEALERRFTRVSLGGVRDEAEVRGHRRTYVGALPGRIIHSLQRCETRNPLLMLDEVDKMGSDVLGDPTGALRKAALEVVERKAETVRVTAKNLEKYAGQPKVQSEVAGRAPEVGVSTALAWTPVGGDIMFIEAIQMPGRGQITLTGQLGDVMKESAQAAWSLLRARAGSLGIPLDAFTQTDVHLHVPAGAVPKDGPSAGIAIAAALASLLCRRPSRHDVAMTGELTLRGRVLPIGGLKEKLTAAARAGVHTVLVPARNKSDLVDVPDEVKKLLDIKPVDTLDEVLELALLEPRRSRPVVVPVQTDQPPGARP